MRRYASRGLEWRPWAAPPGGAVALPADGDARADRDVEARLIDEAPDPIAMPQCESLTLVRRGRRQYRELADPAPQTRAQFGQIVEDRIDGHRIYPDPPRRVRSVNRRGRLLERASPGLLPFALLAWVQACMLVADAWSAGNWTAPGAAQLALRLVQVCALCLLPAAVLLWRRDAWRSAPLVFVGAIVWTTLPALAGIAAWLVTRAPGLTERFGGEAGAAAAAAAAGACLGPALIALGLERLRRSPATWLRPVTTRGAWLAAVLVVFNAGRWLPLAQGSASTTSGGAMDALHLAGSVTGALDPLLLLSLALLGCSTVSAFSADEAQRRLWQCLMLGAALFAAASFYELGAGELLGSLAMSGQPALADRGWYGVVATAVLAAGSLLLFLGFSSPVWSAAPDAEGSGLAAPEEIFAWGSVSEAGGEPIPMSAIVAVAAGADHALAVDRFGRVGAWGDDARGQTDVPDDLVGVVAVAAGDGFSLALRGDGTVAAWGSNDLGETSVPADLSGVTAIAAGRGFALALKADGTIAGWGDRCAGAMAVPAGLIGVTAISAGVDHALALRLDGSVVGWGDDRYGQASVPPGLGRVKAISAGGNFSLALLFDGTVTAWGDGSYGQLDVPRRLRNVVAISAGAFHALALLADGDVAGWGGGSRSQGESTHPWHLVDFKAVAAGDGYSLALRAA